MTNVLCVCTGNSCRFRMAEGWLRALAGDRIQADSAGIEVQGCNERAVFHASVAENTARVADLIARLDSGSSKTQL